MSEQPGGKAIAKTKGMTISATIIRANGSREELGIICGKTPSLFQRIKNKLKQLWR